MLQRRPVAPTALGVGVILNLGVLPGDTASQSVGISRDGTTVVGVSEIHAFRWTLAGGMQNLGLLTGATSATARAANGDGSVVTGYCDGGPGPRRSFRWTAATGMQDIGRVNSINGDVTAFGISANGNTIVGGLGLTTACFRWTPSSMDPFYPGNPANAMSSEARAVSNDGSIAVGIVQGGGAFRMPIPPNGSTVFLQPLPNGGATVQALAVSGDGQWPVGTAYRNGEGFQAARWDASGAIQGLGLFNGRTTTARAASFDGSIIVGDVSGGNPNGQSEAFIWSAALGMLDLRAYAASRGVDTTGWELDNAAGISDDGNTIAGTGLFNGQSRAYLMTIPSPTASALVLLAVCSGLRRRRDASVSGQRQSAPR